MAKAYGLVDKRGAVRECTDHKVILDLLKQVQAKFDSWQQRRNLRTGLPTGCTPGKWLCMKPPFGGSLSPSHT